MAVCTAPSTAVHRLGLSGATTLIFLRLAKTGIEPRGHRLGHRHRDGGAPLYFSREWGFWDLAWMVTATPMAVPLPCLIR